MKKIKLFSLLSIFAVIVVVLSVLVLITCSNEQILNDNNGTTQLQVRIHDEPFKSSGKTVTELNITVIKVDIVKAGTGEIVNCPITEEKEMNILEISKSNPVVLSDVSVPSGDYEQLRLVIKNNATIVVDDVSYDIKIPSGEQSGVKLDGNFSIRGKFFRLDLDFIPEESVIYNKGQGYILKPVIKIADIEDREILGYFNGELGGNDIAFCLYDNNTFSSKMSLYPDKELFGDYIYNSSSKRLIFKNLKIDIEIKDWFGNVIFFGRKNIKELNSNAPDPIEIPIKQWTPDMLVSIDGGPDNQLIFYKVDNYNFSKNYSYTKLKVNVFYPDNSKNGKKVIVEIVPKNNSATSLFEYGTFNGNKSEVFINIESSNFLDSSSIKYFITAYLFDENSKENIDLGLSGKKLVPVVTGANFSEITDNPWQDKIEVSVTKDQNKEINISFPKRLNLKMTPNDWSSNNPVISWDAYPGAENGYFVIVLIKDQYEEEDIAYDNDGNTDWDIIFSKWTNNTNIQIYSDKFIVKNPYNPIDFTDLPIKPGDVVRIEVFVLDSSCGLDTTNKTGAMFMDSVNLIR